MTDNILRTSSDEGILLVTFDREDGMNAPILLLAVESDTLFGAVNDYEEMPAAAVTGAAKTLYARVGLGIGGNLLGLDEASGRSAAGTASTRAMFRRNPSFSDRSKRTGAMPLQRFRTGIGNGKAVDAASENRTLDVVSEATAMPAFDPWF